MVPIIGGVTSVFPTLITPNENLYFIVLPLFIQLLSLHWLSERSLSWILFEIVSMVHVIPFSLAALQTLLNPFARGFRVTPKGVYSQKLRLNVWLTLPLGVLWLGNGLALAGLGWRIFRGSELSFSGLEREVVSILMFWGVYNLVILSLAILASIDAPRVETYEWFKFERPVLLTHGDRTCTGFTQLASEGGVRICLDPPVPEFVPGDRVTLEIQSEEWPGTMQLPGEVLKFANQSDIDLKFGPLSGEQHRHLVELLFCRPGQWLRRQHPNELQTAIALVKQVLHPRFRRPDERAEDAIPIA
ncbi:MAG: hypothetical protein HC890_14710 [Chloroflexaceae bacterium]|nr:hypothetical protein [Chloroflexaceae bacterium]